MDKNICYSSRSHAINFPPGAETIILINSLEDEIIFSVPHDKLENLVAGLAHFHKRGISYKGLKMVMRPDFPRPLFYKKLYEEWGLDVEAE